MFPQGSAEMLYRCTSAFTYVNFPSSTVVFFEALVPVHAAGVCAPFHFPVFGGAPGPVHAQS